LSPKKSQSAGFHRIRHFGLIANNGRTGKLALARELLHVEPAAVAESKPAGVSCELARPTFFCAHCGGQMIVLETFVRGQLIRAPPPRPGDP